MSWDCDVRRDGLTYCASDVTRFYCSDDEAKDWTPSQVCRELERLEAEIARLTAENVYLCEENAWIDEERRELMWLRMNRNKPGYD